MLKTLKTFEKIKSLLSEKGIIEVPDNSIFEKYGAKPEILQMSISANSYHWIIYQNFMVQITKSRAIDCGLKIEIHLFCIIVTLKNNSDQVKYLAEFKKNFI